MKILMRGDIWSPSGYSNAIRNYIKCFLSLGHRVMVEPCRLDKIQVKPETFDFYSMLTHFKKPDIIICQTPPPFYTYQKGSINIGYTVWETSTLPFSWVETMNGMDYIFTASQFCDTVFRYSGVEKPIIVIPHIIDYKKFKPGKGLIIKGAEEDLIFLSSFQWIRRKNWESLLVAYLTEFRPNEKVSLVIKTYRSDFSRKEKDVIRNSIEALKRGLNLRYYPKMFLILDKLKDEELPIFYNTGDVFINSSCGEGFSLTTAEAMSCGLIPVVTAWSGQKELISENKKDGFLIGYTIEPAVGGMWFNGYQNWAKITIFELRQVLRHLYNLHLRQPEDFKKIGNLARKRIIDTYSFEVIKKKVKNALDVYVQGSLSTRIL